MNHVLWTMTLFLITGVQCFGGAAIFANNYDSNKPVYLGAGHAPVPNTWLQFTTMEGTPIGAAFGLTEPGMFDIGFFVVPGASNNTAVSFKLQGWVGTNGSSFASANCKCEATIHQMAGSFSPSTMPSPVALKMPDHFIIGGHYTPKPFTLALIGAALLIGLGELIWQCRRKH
ncbi:MAG TPA: hypothetical protein PK256_19505 [Verrucomicrobiota bacterium]|nr:hypothetical protein [Verrucomicrobiota bacterium]